MQLPKFAFEIRKQDPECEFVSKFILPYLQNKLLYEMIEKNVWDNQRK